MAKNYNDYFKISDKNLSNLEKNFILELKKTILNHLEDINVYFNYEICIIQKSKLAYPLFCSKDKNKFLKSDFIFLAIDDYSYYCQVVYQLSHELTHCFIHSNNSKENNKALWIEETICEAMSLYFLKYFYKNWKLCGLYKINNDYNMSFYSYLNNILNKSGNNKLNTCNNLQELTEINDNSQNYRQDRFENVKDLYKLLNKSNIIGLLKYRDYIIPNTILLNIQSYINAFPNNDAIKYLCDIQKTIMKTKETYVSN